MSPLILSAKIVVTLLVAAVGVVVVGLALHRLVNWFERVTRRRGRPSLSRGTGEDILV